MKRPSPPRFRLAAREGCRVSLAGDNDWTIEIFVLEPDIVRVLHVPPGSLAAPRTWSIAPGAEDIDDDIGRDRFDASGFTAPDFALKKTDGALSLATERLRLDVQLDGPFLNWEQRGSDGAWLAIARDRSTHAYSFGAKGAERRHYLERKRSERYYGLGEKTGALNLAGRRLRLMNLDALGYDAATTDPLYKHIPFYITHSAKTGAAFGIFYDTYADCTFDFGAELSNYHGPYRSFAAAGGDLDYYVIAGPQIAEVTRRFTWLTGRPALMPRWAFGYSGSAMSYTDAPDAQARMQDFIEACRRHDILCDSFHLSSGYTSIGKRRYVFNWNRDKFPDPAAFVKSYRDAGVRICANIKPCLLGDHPLLDEAWKKGLLIREPGGEPAWAQFWDGIGVYLDFTNLDTQAWWRAHVKRELLDYGIAATWNDNNEFEIASQSALAGMFGSPAPAVTAKPLQTLLMQRASRQAQRAYAPAERPSLVSRAGAAGMQRYVQTWSGDNFTSWRTLRYNIRMGQGLALSGVSNSGHDVGGFAGPKPDAELFVRWVEAGVFMPRFSIHSWNDDGSASEPWMHPDATEVVRDLIRLRYQLLPYIYDLHWRNCESFEPIVRPTFVEFPDDPIAYEDCDELMLGASLLVATVVEQGATDRTLRLPARGGWRDFWSGARYEGGQRVTVPAPWGRPPFFVRDGAAIPLNIAEQHFDKRAERRGFAIFAPLEGAFEATCREDDGETEAWREGAAGRWRVAVTARADRIDVACFAEGAAPPQRSLSLLVRESEKRPVHARGAREGSLSGWRRYEIG
jgi:alpha-glucosidase